MGGPPACSIAREGDGMAGRKGKASRIAVWVILALLVVGLIGFGTDNFGGSVGSVASVGEEEVDATAYGRALQAELRQLQEATGEPVTLAEMREAGRDEAVLGRLLAQAAIDGEARGLGLSAGDLRVRDAIVAQPAFQGADGQFDAEGYRFVLERAGLTEAEFEADLRAESAREILFAAVAGGVDAPEAYAEAVLGYIGETRDVTWVALDAAALDGPVPDPTEEELAAWFEERSADFTLPETRMVTYAALRPEALAGEVEVAPEEVRALYDARLADYVRPERRLVERLIFPDDEAAEAAAARIASGETSFDALVEERGLSLDDVDLGEAAREDLGAAAEGVFALAEPGVAGPLPTDLGAALFRVNAILAASETPFEAVEADLRAEAALEAARRAVADRATELDDLLAGGATLEELAADAGLEIGTLRLTPESQEGLAADPAVREAASRAAEGDFPEILPLGDGGLFALRLDEVVAPRVPSLDEVREEAVAAWREDWTRERLGATAEGLRERLAAGEAIEGPGLTTRVIEGQRRDAPADGAPAGLVEAAFGAAPGSTAVVEGDPAAVLRVDAATPPDPAAPRNALIGEAVRAQAEQGIAEDLIAAYVRALQAEAGITRDQAAIDAVLAQIP